MSWPSFIRGIIVVIVVVVVVVVLVAWGKATHADEDAVAQT